jgi:hypothetical protein
VSLDISKFRFDVKDEFPDTRDAVSLAKAV